MSYRSLKERKRKTLVLSLRVTHDGENKSLLEFAFVGLGDDSVEELLLLWKSRSQVVHQDLFERGDLIAANLGTGRSDLGFGRSAQSNDRENAGEDRS